MQSVEFWHAGVVTRDIDPTHVRWQGKPPLGAPLGVKSHRLVTLTTPVGVGTLPDSIRDTRRSIALTAKVNGESVRWKPPGDASPGVCGNVSPHPTRSTPF
jgi:hypothetical protein